MKGKLAFSIAICFLLGLVFAGFLPGSQATAQNESECITCHRDESPGIVDQWLSSAMSGAGLDCATCHGANHMDENDADEALIPTPDTCAPCHNAQVTQYREGKHALAWAAMEAMPAWSHLPMPVQSIDTYKSCSGCHKVGEKPAEIVEAQDLPYGTAACNSCHTRHAFSKEEALEPQACLPCHQGFDHPQWEMWSTSKHGVIYDIDGGGDRAPKCQDCHLIDGTHTNITPWGFLGLRLPEEDDEWMADRAVILQGLGILDDNGDPTARLDIVSGAKVARLTAEEFNTLRAGIVEVCEQCHSADYVAGQMQASDQILKEADELMAEAILIVKELYNEGILELPEGYEFGPDLLQFFSTGSAIEQELFVMFLEYRNRTFMGAFHNNPDYMWWYGYAPMQESLQNIKDEAVALRSEGGAVGPQGPPGPTGPAGPAGEAAPMWIIWAVVAVAAIALLISLYVLMIRRKTS